MSAPGEPSASARLWEDLRNWDGIGELPFPWPVAGAVRLGEHASLRRFYRLIPGEVEHASPDTLVLVVYESEDAEAIARYERAALWFLAAGVHVPRIHGRSSRALLVEDGGDDLLADAAVDGDLDDRYAEAAGVVVALQSHGLTADGPNPDWRLDRQRLRRELEFTEEHALRGWLEAGPSPIRSEAFDRLAVEVARQPTRMCHRDFHSRNLLVGDELMVVDFQDAMAGPMFYDLVSLLHDDYREVPASARATALEMFCSADRTEVAAGPAALVPAEPALLRPGARQGYTFTAAQRSLKALGTFGYQVSVAGRHEYANYAGRTWRHARRALAALGWDDLIDALAVFDRL